MVKGTPAALLTASVLMSGCATPIPIDPAQYETAELVPKAEALEYLRSAPRGLNSCGYRDDALVAYTTTLHKLESDSFDQFNIGGFANNGNDGPFILIYHGAGGPFTKMKCFHYYGDSEADRDRAVTALMSLGVGIRQLDDI